METLLETANFTQETSEIYRSNLHLISNGSAEIVNAERTKAFDSFLVNGLPEKGSEDYKYIDLSSVFRGNYSRLFESKKLEVDFSSLFKCNVPELDSYLIILVNGWYYRTNLKYELPKGVELGGFKELSNKYPALIEQHYNKYTGDSKNGLAALNTAFAQDGYFIYLPENAVIDKPIQVINILVHDTDYITHPRNFIYASHGSSVKIVVCDHTLTPWRFVDNQVTEVVVNERAQVELYAIQDENNSSVHLNSIFVNQKEGSSFTSNISSIHGGLIRNNIFAYLNGERCETNILGLYLNDRKQHIDNYTFVDHAFPNCTSTQLFKGVLDDESTGSFNGRIIVREDAQKTAAFQRNNNVLMSENAKIHTKPQLEIYADDVKCSHGATVGQIDENALFYMRARGISEKEARLMLMYAFAHDVISKINFEPLQDRISELVEKRLRGELSRCSQCVVSLC